MFPMLCKQGLYPKTLLFKLYSFGFLPLNNDFGMLYFFINILNT